MFTQRNVFLRNNRNLKRLFSVKDDKKHPTVTVKQGKLQGKANKLFDGTPYYSFKGIPYAQTPLGEQRFKKNSIVTIKQGKLRGSVERLFDGTSYYSFKGIPYAQTPVGEHRFKAPLPPKNWQGIRDATEHGPICPHFDITTQKIVEGNEECLFLNIYTKSLEDSKFPVMVFIHGGGFMSGSGDSSTYGPQFLIQHDVLLVTFNYRLEALGFLCLDTPEVPGNAGLKDQVAALRWVQENINKFGGDPDNVTIFGQSAGGASVTYHILSELSKGLFHKAIAQSGCCLQDWTFDIDAVNRAFRTGKHLGIETDDKEVLLRHLRKCQAKDLVAMTLPSRSSDEIYRGLNIFFTPVVEKPKNVEKFITSDPVEKLFKGKVNNVPLMIGCTSAEGIFVLYTLIRDANFLNQYPSYLLPKEIAVNVTEEKLSEMGERVKQFYFKDKDICSETMEQIKKFQTDRLFVYNCHRFANFYSALAPTYMYKFDCNTDLNYLKKRLRVEVSGVCHADDIYYLFCSRLNSELYNKQENLKSIVDKITKLWTDFAKTGNPTPDDTMGFQWESLTPTEDKYLLINENSIKMSSRPDAECIQFWNELYEEAGLPGVNYMKNKLNLQAKY